MMELFQERPIVFFDLEATGVNILNDRIVEISVVKIFPDGRREVKTRRINPEMHIPEEASGVDGIYDRDVENEPTFRAISRNFFIYLEDCDLGGYNITKFDIPMLTREFSRAGLSFTTANRRIIDAYNIFCRMEPRNLSAAYKFFCGKEMKDAHSAEADTLATVEGKSAATPGWQRRIFPKTWKSGLKRWMNSMPSATRGLLTVLIRKAVSNGKTAR